MSRALSFRRQTPRDDQMVYDPVATAYVPAIRLQAHHYTALSSASTANALFATATTGQADPTGGTGAVKITDDNNNVYHMMQYIQLTGAGDFQGFPGEKDAGQHAWSVHMKAGTSTKVDVVHYSETAGSIVDRFNLSTGAHEVDAGEGKIFIEPSLLDTGSSGWWRIFTVGKLFQNPASGNGENQVKLHLVNGAGVGWNAGSGYAGASDRDFYVYGYQAENAVAAVGAIATPYSSGAMPFDWGASPGAEQLSYPVEAAPANVTIYARFLERGNAIMANATQQSRQAGILRIGNSGRTAADSFEIVQTATGFTATLNNGGVTSVSSVTASPAFGDAIELRATISATGVVQLSRTINGAAETSGTAGSAAGLPTAWNDPVMYVNSCGNTLYGDLDLISLKLLNGTKTLVQAVAA